MSDNIVSRIKYILFRNNYSMRHVPSKKKRVNVEYSSTVNVGDSLSPLIVKWMLDRKEMDIDTEVSRTKHLFAVGSVLGRSRFDASVWGTGIISEEKEKSIVNQKKYRKYDIRAVRGPRSREVLLRAGYDCPEVYGDPAILMPFIYEPISKEKKYPVSIILHHRTEISDKTDEKSFSLSIPKDIHVIDPCTTDYQFFINEIVASEYVISSSLHGIILAESYGVPVVFLRWGIKDQLFKFDDWYMSTGRETKAVNTIEEALGKAELCPVDFSEMQQKLVKVFPYDLWK